LNLNDFGLIYQKSKKNIDAAKEVGGPNQGYVSKIETGDFVRFIEPDDVFELGTTTVLDSNLNFPNLLTQMGTSRASVPINRKITLIEYTNQNADPIDMYKLYTSHLDILKQYIAHKQIGKGETIMHFVEEVVTFEDFLKDESGIFELLCSMFLKYIVMNVLEPLYYNEMDSSDHANPKLKQLFEELLLKLTFDADFFDDYEMLFDQESFAPYVNNFLIEKQTSNLLIETVMMSVATDNHNLFIQLLTEDIETNEEVQNDVEDTLGNIFYTFATNVYRSVKRELEIKPTVKLIAKIKPIFDDFNSKIVTEPTLAKYKDAFTALVPLSMPVFISNFTPEIIEVFFWSFQLNYDDFFMHYLYFSDMLPNFADYFADDDQKLSGDKVKEVWKYVHPEQFSEFKTKNFTVIKQSRRTLV